MTLKRIDPSDCGCTDCLTGHSKPFNTVTEFHLQGLRDGMLLDSTSGEFDNYIEQLRMELRYDERTLIGRLMTNGELTEMMAKPDEPSSALIQYQDERGIALRLGENLSREPPWLSGEIIVFWQNGDNTVLPDSFVVLSLGVMEGGRDA